MKPIVLLLFLLLSFLYPSPSEPFSRPDPWIAIEEGILQVHEKYQPKSSILNSRTFSEKMRRYLDAGLWSSAEILLNNSKDPSVLQFQVELHLLRREYAEVFNISQDNPFLFMWHPDFIFGAAQGALEQGAFSEALRLLASPEASDLNKAKRLYLTSLAYWGLKDKDGLDETFERSALWSKENADSPWAGRLSLLKTYFHLSKTEYALAFENLGSVFEEDIDLALLTLIWGYFKLDASGNLFSVLQAFDDSQEKSPYYIQTYRILSRSLAKSGDLRGAIEMDQRIRDELRARVTQLEEETEMMKQKVVTSSISSPAGALLSKTLLYDLDEHYAQKREIKAILCKVALWDSSTTRQKAEDALHLFYVRYVESSLYYPVMMRLGALYHETGRSMKAAEIFEEASRLPISVALSHKVLDHAIELYEDAGLWEKVYLHAMKRAKEFQGRQVEERPFLVKAAEMKFKLGETAEAREILTDLISASEKDTPEQKVLDEEGGVPDYLAKAYFLLAESKIADFAEIKLVEPLDMNLQKKTRLFEDFLSEYRYAMVHPSPGVILNATHRIGEICEEFSRSLLRSARLPELTVEEAQMYDSFLKEQALSYIELAKEAYIENIELGKSMEVVNKWTEKSSRRLKRIYQIIAFNTLEQEFYP